MASEIGEVERRLWDVADQLRANSGLKPSEYSRPVLGLLLLRYAEGRFSELEKELKPKPGGRRGAPGPDAFKARGVIYLTHEARFSYLLALPEGTSLGRALNQRAINRWPDHGQVTPTRPNAEVLAWDRSRRIAYAKAMEKAAAAGG